MTKQEFKDFANDFGTFQALIELESECDELTNYECLIDYAKHCIDEDYLATSIDILQVLLENGNYNCLYRYDYCSGMTPIPVYDFEDIEDLLDDDIDDEEMPIEWTKPIHETEDDYYGEDFRNY